MKKLEDLTFADDFMFGYVMQDKEICKELLETLLGIKIEKIEFPEIQKQLVASYQNKSVRLDVFASDPKRNFDIELQMIKHEALPQRMRYYQSIMDIDALLRGRKYADLKENYVIFICLFDPFCEGRSVYFFENTCRENPALKLGDKSFKVCYNVNAFAKEQDVKVKAFLEYVKTQNAKDDFTQKLEEIVLRTKMSDDARRDYMMRNIFADDWFDRGVAQGMERGKTEGIAIGEKRGVAQGIMQGEHKKAIETASALLSLGVVTQEQIAQVTGLPLAEIEQLTNSRNRTTNKHRH